MVRHFKDLIGHDVSEICAVNIDLPLLQVNCFGHNQI